MEGVAEITETLRRLHHLDKDVTLAINGWNSPVSDTIWQFFSDTNDTHIWFVLYLAVAALVIVRLGWKKGLLLIACCVVCVVGIDQIDNLVKAGVQRLRPVHDADMMSRGLHVLEVPGKLYGFFSAHAATSASFVTCTMLGLSYSDKRHSYTLLGVLLSLWAILVGVSRVFVGKHFLGDVLVGLAVGVAFGFLFAWIYRLLCNKLRLTRQL